MNNIVTLKSELEITQGHSKWYHSKAWVYTQYWCVTDGRTDGRTDRQTASYGIVRAMHTDRVVKLEEKRTKINREELDELGRR